MKVSILVPVYNSEKYLRKCLTSLVNQTLEDLEIIVIDDGSTDGSGKIIDEYANKYNFFKAYHQNNIGVVKTRSKALMLSSGEYIGWVDSDDFVEPEMFEILYDTVRSDHSDLAYCDYDFYPRKIATKEKWFKNYDGKTKDWNLIERNTQQWNKLVSRELLKKLNMAYWMELCGEGAYAFAMIAAKKISVVHKELYHYRVGHTSLSNNAHNPEWYEKNVLKAKKQLEAADILIGGWHEYFKYRVIYAVLQSMLIASFNNNKEIYQKNKKRLKELDYKSNRYLQTILTNNHGKLKAIILVEIIPSNFQIAKLISTVALKK